MTTGPVYGSPGRPGDVVARELIEELGLAPSEVAACIRTAGAGARPPVRNLEDLAGAEPAVFYYFARLAAAVAAEKRSSMDTNRPDYAPDRRPGDPSPNFPGDYIDATARDLVAFHATSRDARVIAELIEAGAAALKYAPGYGGAVGVNARAELVDLGKAAAKTLRAEAARIRGRETHRRNEAAKAERKAERERKQAGA